MTHLVGRRLGRYEIEQEIGRGGMARVYRATDTVLQRQVAIKLLAPQLSIDPEFARRFEREAVTAANLRHPNIVTVYDVGEQDGLHYIAMEFIRGRTLHAILEDHGALGLEYALPILTPLASALDYAHSQGAVHRDVKPHNIMLDIDGRVLLTDFGIVQAQEPEGERLTRTGIFMGTPEYMSPEQAEAGRVDGRSDLYSFGIVAYEIVTGRVPFSGATPQLIVAHAQTPPPPPTSFVPYLPSDLDTVLARALAKHPRSRFATAAIMVEALQIVARRYNIPLAGPAQLAALAQVNEHTAVTAPAAPGGRTPVSAGLPPALQNQRLNEGRPLTAPPPPLLSLPNSRGRTNIGQRQLALTLGGTLVGGMLLIFLLLVFRGGITAPTVTPTPALPNLGRSPAATDQSAIPLATLRPTVEPSTPPTVIPPTFTPELPTEALPPTSEPPTAVPAPQSTATRRPQVQPSATAEPASTTPVLSATPEPPSATPEPPSATPEPPSATPEPPSATPTRTPEPPTRTFTPGPPTETPLINASPIIVTPIFPTQSP